MERWIESTDVGVHLVSLHKACASCVIASCITASCIITSCIIECYFKHLYDCGTCTSTCHFGHPYEACAGAVLSLDGRNRQRRPGKRVEEAYQPSVSTERLLSGYYPPIIRHTSPTPTSATASCTPPHSHLHSDPTESSTLPAANIPGQ